MDGIKYAVFTNKSIQLFEKNQYTLNVESGLTRTEIKQWVELFFGVKVIGIVIDFPERVKEQDALWNIQCITDV